MNLKHVARALARGSCPCYQPGKVEAVSRHGNVGQSRAQRRCEAQSLSLATAHLGTPTRSCEHARASLPEGAGGRRRAKARPGRAGVTAQTHGLGYSRLSSFPPTTDSWANAANIRPAGSDRRWPWELPFFFFLTQYELITVLHLPVRTKCGRVFTDVASADTRAFAFAVTPDRGL